MPVPKPDPSLIQFLSRYEPRITKLAVALRRIVLEEAPGASEIVFDANYAISNIFTFSGRPKEAFCMVVSFRNHVNLAFNHGAEFPDPDGRLEGTGVAMRHIKVREPAGLKDPALREFIRVALDRASVMGGPVALKRQVVSKKAQRHLL